MCIFFFLLLSSFLTISIHYDCDCPINSYMDIPLWKNYTNAKFLEDKTQLTSLDYRVATLP